MLPFESGKFDESVFEGAGQLRTSGETRTAHVSFASATHFRSESAGPARAFDDDRAGARAAAGSGDSPIDSTLPLRRANFVSGLEARCRSCSPRRAAVGLTVFGAERNRIAKTGRTSQCGYAATARAGLAVSKGLRSPANARGPSLESSEILRIPVGGIGVEGLFLVHSLGLADRHGRPHGQKSVVLDHFRDLERLGQRLPIGNDVADQAPSPWPRRR